MNLHLLNNINFIKEVDVRYRFIYLYLLNMIHKYKLNGYNIVIDVNSGTVHIFDDIVFDILDYIDENMQESIPNNIISSLEGKYKKEDLIDSYYELYSLYKSGQLFSEDCYEKFANMMVESPIKAMCLNISHDCNLRCEYCFAAKGDFGQGRMLMSLETAKKAIDFLVKNSGSRNNLEVDFFGGEPLMNFDVVKEVVNYARSLEKEHNKRFRFTITTNGLLLSDEKIDFINKEMSNVVLSLDGRKEINDLLRITPNNKGCYDSIVPKYLNLINKRIDKDYYVRGTFTKNNLDFTNDIMHMVNLGFKHLSIEPVVSDPKLDYSIKEEDLLRVYEEYEKLANKIIDCKISNSLDFNFFHFLIDLEQGPCAIKRLRGCGCGNEYVAVTPQGDIFPCHQFVGNDDWRMGNLHDNIFNYDIKSKFAKSNIYSKEDCKDCWAKFYCSGGCNANNLQYEGDILKSHKIACELEKKRLECAIMIKVALS